MEHESGGITRSSEESLSAREKLFKLSQSYPATDTERERSAGLFLRGSLLARFLAIYEIYKEIIELPGFIFDVGTWRGQTAVLAENFRAILEPLNLDRRICAFDTFEGYRGFGERDKPTQLHRDGKYSVGTSYEDYLRELLEIHEISNAMGHYREKHLVIAGDVTKTMPALLNENPEMFIACAFIDLNSVEPTELIIDLIWERLVPNGRMVFWQLTQPKTAGDGMAYVSRILGSKSHLIRRSLIYPGLTQVVKTQNTLRI
jgi:hypothetical protein